MEGGICGTLIHKKKLLTYYSAPCIFIIIRSYTKLFQILMKREKNYFCFIVAHVEICSVSIFIKNTFSRLLDTLH